MNKICKRCGGEMGYFDSDEKYCSNCQKEVCRKCGESIYSSDKYSLEAVMAWFFIGLLLGTAMVSWGWAY